ncbi:DNA-binding protein [Purpureocillium lavendulum]|uniref:DNA-binding protein n=1 Tax=Purpureocillium lavendulum TaxID=1247861 RepID=A0AB34FPL1_9HYPO|nr:DNA-binding protein [Purpureocillium lavendulum]
MKDNNTVIEEFNEVVNMTAQELEKWLKSDDSQSAGWPKDGGDADGESVGHDSGRKIVEILESNPDKDPEKYTDDQIQHMRKVVSYCKRHLAQEEKANDEKSAEEVKKTKSYASLKNWGHDLLKKRQEKGDSKSDSKKDEGEGDKQAGDKRKVPADKEDEDNDEAPNKKRETGKGESANGDDETNGKKEANGDNSKANGEAKKSSETKESGDAGGDKKKGGGGAENGPDVGETVSWNWGNGQPEGKVLDVKEEKTTITTKRGNQVSRDGDPEDPAVVLDTGKSKAIKSAHELND